LRTRIRAADIKGIKRLGIRKALAVAVGIMLSVTVIRIADALVSVMIESAVTEGKAWIGPTQTPLIAPPP
jgi:hypothetical protein